MWNRRRSFVAEGAPLDDGQKRRRFGSDTSVTVRALGRGLTYAAPPALDFCGSGEAPRCGVRRECEIEERSFVAEGAPLDDGQKRRRVGSDTSVTVRALGH